MALRPQQSPNSLSDEAAEIYAAMHAASVCLRLRSALLWLAAIFPLALMSAATWIAFVRFTLVELPAWPAGVIFASWLVVWLVWVARYRPAQAQAARFLDRVLNLDERVSTWLEIERGRRFGRSYYAHVFAGRQLLVDTVEKLRERRHRMPAGFSFKPRLVHVVAVSVGLLALAAAITLPTPLDEVRAERAALRRAVQAQMEQIAALRQELAAHPSLPANLRSALLAELAGVEQQLSMTKLDREAMIAALADAQERVRRLTSASASDFDQLVAAARVIQSGAAENSNWEPAESPETTDLGRAAEASEFLADYIPQFTDSERREVAQALERASDIVSTRHAELSEDLTASAKALRAQDERTAFRSLRLVAGHLREANRGRESALAVESTLAKLEEARQSMAQAGLTTGRRTQVGFRRRDAITRLDPALTGANGGQGTQADAGDMQGAGSNRPQGEADQSIGKSGMGPRVGQNVPAFGSQAGSNRGAGGSTSSGSDSGRSGNSGTGSDREGGNAQQSADQQAQNGSTGTLQGPVSAPITGANGAISRVQNPAGRGVGGGSQPDDSGSASDEQGDEKVYVPGPIPQAGEDRSTTVAGQQETDPARTEGLEGRASGGTNGELTQAGRGPGVLTPIHTPYREIIGEYARLAMQALDRTYIPSDARQYVRDYFTELGK
jgi:hypothetical protein